MRNRILSLTRNSIPYVRELQPIAGSVAGCILMQQLDYWFERFPGGFYKFMAPTDHSRYKPGESWCEELGISVDEFRTAFDRIGSRYKSKGLYENTADKFGEKFYASFIDRRTNLTYYLRNHERLDDALDRLTSKPTKLAAVNGKSPLTVNGHIQSTVDEQTPVAQIGIPYLQETGNLQLHITETTTKTTQRLQLQPAAEIQLKGSGCNSLIFPAMSEKERDSVGQLISGCPLEFRQPLLDELAGAISHQKIRDGITPYFRALTLAAKNRTFSPNLGVSIQATRQATERQTAMRLSSKTDEFDSCAMNSGAQVLAKIRRRQSLKSEAPKVGIESSGAT